MIFDDFTGSVDVPGSSSVVMSGGKEDGRLQLRLVNTLPAKT